MANQVSIHFELDEGASRVRCRVEVHDPELHGHAAELRVRRTVEVHDSRPVNASDVLLERRIESLGHVNEIEIHRASLQAYSYSGSNISVTIHSELEVDTGVVFDTTIREEEEIALGGKPSISNDAKGVVEPADAFDLVTNIKAIPPQNRLITTALLLIGAVVIAINTWVGVHDQFVPEPMTWFYDHRDSDGDSESPIQKSLAGSGVLGAAIWLAVKRQLRKYMRFEICNVPGQIRRGNTFRASAILRGVSRVDLHDVRLRVVACNMEKGQYKRGSGTKTRTVSFTEPVRAVVLYDRQISEIPAGVPVEGYFEGEIAFEPMFQALYPPQTVSRNHGIDVYWEVQLIHDELVDQELVGPVSCFAWQDFLEA